jgi:hypothetical protein
MSKPKDDWFKNAVWTVRNYPARKEEYEELHTQSISSGMSGMPKSSDISRTIENIATREMAPMKQLEYDAVTRAITVTKLLPDGEKRVEMIDKMYWRGKKMNIDDVLYPVGIAEATGKRWHGAFIRLVGEFMGYIA